MMIALPGNHAQHQITALRQQFNATATPVVAIHEAALLCLLEPVADCLPRNTAGLLQFAYGNGVLPDLDRGYRIQQTGHSVRPLSVLTRGSASATSSHTTTKYAPKESLVNRIFRA